MFSKLKWRSRFWRTNANTFGGRNDELTLNQQYQSDDPSASPLLTPSHAGLQRDPRLDFHKRSVRRRDCNAAYGTERTSCAKAEVPRGLVQKGEWSLLQFFLP